MSMTKLLLLAGSVIVLATLNTSAYAVDKTSTPTVDEVKAAFTGVTRETTSRRSGKRMKITYHPGGKLERNVTNGPTSIRTWRVAPDSSICQETRSGERCWKTVKEGNLVYQIFSSGKRTPTGYPIKDINTPEYAVPKTSTPTVEEVKAAFSRAVRKTKSRRSGKAVKRTYHPDGKLKIVITNGPTTTRNWWVDPDSALCQETRSGEQCSKTVKEGNFIFIVLRNGKKTKKGWPIKK